MAVNREGSEITAIPEVLRLVGLCGAIVAIDAMGRQAEIARQVVEGGGDYILAVKGGRETLHDGIMEHFPEHMGDDFARVGASHHETAERGRGREEQRTYYVCDVPEGPPDARRWEGPVQIGVAISDTVRNGETCDDVRYYSFLPLIGLVGARIDRRFSRVGSDCRAIRRHSSWLGRPVPLMSIQFTPIIDSMRIWETTKVCEEPPILIHVAGM